MKRIYIVLLLLSANVFGDPLDDATALVFEWLSPPAPQSDWPAFNAALSEVVSSASAARAASESLKFARDGLSYHRSRQKADEIDEAELWQYARSLVEARQIEDQRRLAYVTALNALSKRWGGDRWWELRELLVAYTGWHPDGCDTDAVRCEYN